MNHDINPCATPYLDTAPPQPGGAWPSSASPSPARMSARRALDEYFHWHRIRRMSRK